MDPDKTLEEIREHIKSWEDDRCNVWDSDKFLTMYCDLVDKINALDRWMSMGGFLPREWERY